MTIQLADLPGPLFFGLAALAVAILSYLVHRWQLVSGLIASAGCLVLGWISLQQLTDKPASLLGQALTLNPSFAFLGRMWAFTTPNLIALSFVLIVAGLTFLLALAGSQSWSFYPAGAAIVAVLVLAITAQQHIYAVLFLWLAANLAVFVLAGGRPGATTGALRFLAFTSLGAMLLLIVPGFLDANLAQPDSLAGPGISPEDASQAASLLVVIGFGILLMMVPFHGQLVTIAADGAPMVPAFVLSVFPAVVFLVLLNLGQAYPDLLKNRLLFDVCRWSGTAAVAIGGVGALAQRRWGYMVGYATLVDWGAGLIALGQGTPRGLEQATLMLVWRALSLLLVGTGLTAVFKGAGKKDDILRCKTLLLRKPLSAAALLIGLLSLAAFPLTAGAAGRWPLILDLMASQPRIAWTLVLAGVGVGVGTLSRIWTCLSAPAQDEEGEMPLQEPRVQAIVDLAFALLALWLVGYLFLHPLPWLAAAEQFLAGFNFLPS
jgi:formate hydrogenlyase subunit 3/multisubunit Na+/H+ antiporter MnhD subunit